MNEISQELLLEIISGLKANERSLEDNFVEIDGVRYRVTGYKDDGWDD